MEIASERMQAAGQTNVSFVNEDIFTVAFDDDFDAVVGCYVLVHNQDKARLLRRVSQHVYLGGLVVFQEPDYSMSVATLPRAQFFEQVCHWRVEALRRAGLEGQTGLKMFGLFLEAGLPVPEVRFPSLE